MNFFSRQHLYVSSIFLILFLTGCGGDNKKIIPGYIDADFIYLSSNYGGTLQICLLNEVKRLQRIKNSML
jgi:hypothetical protein